MTISYNWLSEYLPLKVDPDRLSHILTSIGLEVEKMEVFEEVKGGLKGLFIGEVLEVEKHPNADKLKLTKVKIGDGLLNIVCGAPNVAKGQKVVVAPVGATIYPQNAEPLTMKLAKIRGEESQGMICAEDEIGLGHSHDGILVLPDDAKPGMAATEYFQPYSDIIYEIGLTPNRMDAMSHWGVARDVCAYLSHHDRQPVRPVYPHDKFEVGKKELGITVTIENTEACRRYSGVCITGIKVESSPKWLQHRLNAIGLRPVNNVVDITNYIQYETGQPLHAFDYSAISGQQVIVKTLAADTPFKTLDEKERKLDENDLMICNANQPMCIAGVFGGAESGVSERTTTLFLESAWFHPVFIRKTSYRHNLRTDAASRFEKGTDISKTVDVLKRAATLIKQITGGAIASEIVDVYPVAATKKEVVLPYQYLKKLTGKVYHPQSVKNILESLQFTVVKEGIDAMVVQVPLHKPDISLPADIVEEIIRIDGLDNIPIPTAITITPSVEENQKNEKMKEKLAGMITGLGFSEILTNSLTNSAYFSSDQLNGSVALLNNLSTELNVLRPFMMHTALEVIGFNLNRKNSNLKLFEFGKTYRRKEEGGFFEKEHLCLYITGMRTEAAWNAQPAAADVYYLKGLVSAIAAMAGISAVSFTSEDDPFLDDCLQVKLGRQKAGKLGRVNRKTKTVFDLKQEVFYADIDWELLLAAGQADVSYKEISKFPQVERDLAMVVTTSTKYEEIQREILKLNLASLHEMKLFDVFESEKIGKGKKSLAVNFIFRDDTKTLTDNEIDNWMQKIMSSLEKNLEVEIRKQ